MGAGPWMMECHTPQEHQSAVGPTETWDNPRGHLFSSEPGAGCSPAKSIRGQRGTSPGHAQLYQPSKPDGQGRLFQNRAPFSQFPARGQAGDCFLPKSSHPPLNLEEGMKT